jgi:hypothetical protein
MGRSNIMVLSRGFERCVRVRDMRMEAEVGMIGLLEGAMSQ